MDSEWLKPDVITSVVNTGTTAVLAGVALVFGYRQNVGWKPIIFTHGTRLSGMGGKHRHTLGLTVEFWNRRKYPLVVRGYEAAVSGVEILSYPPGEGKPYVRQGSVYYSSDKVVNPQERVDLPLDVDFENQSLDAMRAELRVCVRYFDAYRNRMVSARSYHKFFYPELGWKLTETERERAREAYAGILSAAKAKEEAEAACRG